MDKKALDLGRITEHRKMIYGFCALWIMLFHADFRFPSAGVWRLPSVFQNNGACGVELFMILSAIGLYHSMEKGPDLIDFYKKRFIRVYLPTLIVATVYQVYAKWSPRVFLQSLSIFGYWFGKRAWWFTAYIMSMYMVYPLLHFIQKRNRWILPILFIASFAVAFYVEATQPVEAVNLIRGVTRIPVFLFGCILAPFFKSRARVSKIVMIVIVVLSMLVLLIYSEARSLLGSSISYSIRAVAYMVGAVGILPLITALGEACVCAGRAGRAVYRLLSFYGGFSLECYLLFERIQNVLTAHFHPSGSEETLLVACYALFYTTVLGFLLRTFCVSLVSHIEGEHLPERARSK